MVRTQIQLTKEQHRKLKDWAGELGISLAEAVRRCVAEHLASREAASDHQARIRAALAVVGKYADEEGASRVAKDHDDVLVEAYRR